MAVGAGPGRRKALGLVVKPVLVRSSDPLSYIADNPVINLNDIGV